MTKLRVSNTANESVNQGLIYYSTEYLSLFQVGTSWLPVISNWEQARRERESRSLRTYKCLLGENFARFKRNSKWWVYEYPTRKQYAFLSWYYSFIFIFIFHAYLYSNSWTNLLGISNNIYHHIRLSLISIRTR